MNLSGVIKGNKDIIEIGKGNHEQDMLNLLLQKGYNKAFGILGHQSEEDVEKVLIQNLNGLYSLNLEYNG